MTVVNGLVIKSVYSVLNLLNFQDRNPIEIAQVNRIRRCVNSIAKPQSIDINSGEMERRQYVSINLASS